MIDTEQTVVQTAEARWGQLEADASQFVKRGARCATLTIPTLFRENSNSSGEDIKDPVQSIGARGVNNISSKLVLSLFPMNTSFFKLNVDELALAVGEQDDAQMTEIETGLGTVERTTLKDIESSGDITGLFEALKHLVVVGNVLIYAGKAGLRIYDLHKYRVVRSPEGQVLEIVIKEAVAPASLPADTLAKIRAASPNEQGPAHNDKNLTVYTHVKLVGDKHEWFQECSGRRIEGSEGTSAEETSPWIALRFLRVDGEAYGRSYVEMYLGDLNTLETLSTAIRDGSAAAAKVLFLVRPNGTTNMKVLAEAENLSVRSGDANDVTVLQMNKAADFGVAKQLADGIEARLSYAFMMNASVMRDAERVTAEEVRYVAQELDDGLGGIYSLLSKDLQLPYVRRRLHLTRQRHNLPKLPDIVSPAIVTGFAALGRGHDRDKLMRFVKAIVDMVGPELMMKIVNVREIIMRIAVSDGIDTKGLIIPEQVAAQGAEQEQGQALMEKLGPEVIRQMGNAALQQETPQPTQGAVNG